MDCNFDATKKSIIVSKMEAFEEAMLWQPNELPVCLCVKSHKYVKQSISDDILELAIRE